MLSLSSMPAAVARELIGELHSRAAHCGVRGAREAFDNVQDVSKRRSSRAQQGEVSRRQR